MFFVWQLVREGNYLKSIKTGDIFKAVMTKKSLPIANVTKLTENI